MDCSAAAVLQEGKRLDEERKLLGEGERLK